MPQQVKQAGNADRAGKSEGPGGVQLQRDGAVYRAAASHKGTEKGEGTICFLHSQARCLGRAHLFSCNNRYEI